MDKEHEKSVAEWEAAVVAFGRLEVMYRHGEVSARVITVQGEYVDELRLAVEMGLLDGGVVDAAELISERLAELDV